MNGIITVLGKDSVGIIAKVCVYLSENNINILDIFLEVGMIEKMYILEEMFLLQNLKIKIYLSVQKNVLWHIIFCCF